MGSATGVDATSGDAPVVGGVLLPPAGLLTADVQPESAALEVPRLPPSVPGALLRAVPEEAFALGAAALEAAGAVAAGFWPLAAAAGLAAAASFFPLPAGLGLGEGLAADFGGTLEGGFVVLRLALGLARGDDFGLALGVRERALGRFGARALGALDGLLSESSSASGS